MVQAVFFGVLMSQDDDCKGLQQPHPAAELPVQLPHDFSAGVPDDNMQPSEQQQSADTMQPAVGPQAGQLPRVLIAKVPEDNMQLSEAQQSADTMQPADAPQAADASHHKMSHGPAAVHLPTQDSSLVDLHLGPQIARQTFLATYVSSSALLPIAGHSLQSSGHHAALGI